MAELKNQLVLSNKKNQLSISQMSQIALKKFSSEMNDSKMA